MGDVGLRPCRVEAERMGSAGRQGWGFSQNLALGRAMMSLGRSLQAPGKGKCLCQAVAGLEGQLRGGSTPHVAACWGKGLGGARGMAVFGFGFLAQNRLCRAMWWVNKVPAVPPGHSLTPAVSWELGVSLVPLQAGNESRLAGVGQAQRGSAGRDFSACTSWDEEGKGGQGSPALSSPFLGLWARKALWEHVGCLAGRGWRCRAGTQFRGCILSVLLPPSS